MGFVDDILADTLPAVREPQHVRAWPTGRYDTYGWESTWGHDDSLYSPETNEAYVGANEVYTVSMARARLLATVDLKFFDRRGRAKKEIDDHMAVERYHHVNPWWSNARMRWMSSMCKDIWGESHWLVEPPNRDSPMGELWWVKPSRMFPLIHPDKYLYAWRYESQVGQQLYFPADRVVWFRYPNPADEWSALPPLFAAKLAADTAQAMVTSNRRLFNQGMQVRGLIVPPKDQTLTIDQVDELEEHFKRRFSGPDKAHQWAVLRQDLEFRQMSFSPKDAEYVSGLNLSFRQVCRAFGMQATLLGDLEQASPGDTKELERIEWGRTLAPDLILESQEVVEQYLPMFHDRDAPRHAEFDFSQVPAMQEVEAARWDRESAMLDRGVYTINELRRRWGLPDVPWGDSPWMPMNKGVWLNEGEEPKGKLVIPGQDPMGGFGGFGGFADESGGNSADDGWPAAAQQGGPVKTGPSGVPSKIPPDQEADNQFNLERGWSHTEARTFLEREDTRDWLEWAFKRSDVEPQRRRANGHRPLQLTR